MILLLVDYNNTLNNRYTFQNLKITIIQATNHIPFSNILINEIYVIIKKGNFK
jgi:hypothetical protein